MLKSFTLIKVIRYQQQSISQIKTIFNYRNFSTSNLNSNSNKNEKTEIKKPKHVLDIIRESNQEEGLVYNELDAILKDGLYETPDKKRSLECLGKEFKVMEIEKRKSKHVLSSTAESSPYKSMFQPIGFITSWNLIRTLIMRPREWMRGEIPLEGYDREMMENQTEDTLKRFIECLNKRDISGMGDIATPWLKDSVVPMMGSLQLYDKEYDYRMQFEFEKVIDRQRGDYKIFKDHITVTYHYMIKGYPMLNQQPYKGYKSYVTSVIFQLNINPLEETFGEQFRNQWKVVFIHSSPTSLMFVEPIIPFMGKNKINII
ncbi:hypothetical protein DLAC_02994 [Tieghemostelium lacteum]|uniref:Tim44-like domain-containing protein n=1 Tax=Tieghemostelium lacteum TaxID=361077 RepID=A0A152A4E0_TIELA|nr:hypothetical protein DLAC_02994 [Tieghemostelium lacteum]|eukprot:KYR00931.1 hypothetical protein DLAC_02994 [Tieghemostelium lacteum]